MADNKKEVIRNNEKIKKELLDLNKTFNDTMVDIATGITGTSPANEEELKRLNREVDMIINAELNNTKSITSDDMSTFMVKLFNDFDTIYVFIFIFLDQMEDLPSDSKWSPSKFTELLNNYLGLKYDEIVKFIYDEQNEWPGEIQILGDSFDDYMIWVF